MNRRVMESTIARGIASIFPQSMQAGEGGGCLSCIADDDVEFYESTTRRMKRKGVKDEEDREHPHDEILASPTSKTHESSYDEEDIEVAVVTGEKLSRTEADKSDPLAAYPITRQSSSFRRRKRSRSESSGSQAVPIPCGDGSQARKQQADRPIYYFLYISALAIIGSCSRVFLSRLFGEDCEDGDMSDFFTPFSSQICVTAGGRSMQTGGALFRDLPANLLGSFLMGFISPHDAQKTSRLPWHKKDHPLQQDDVFHTSLGVGLCGCLTTFASWNSQMVVMLDGSYCELGTQVIPALCGYLLGIMGTCSAFRFGRDTAFWLHSWKNPDNNTDYGKDDDEEEEEREIITAYGWTHYCTKYCIFLVAIILIVLFVLGSVIHEIQFYRNMIMMSLVAPFGALLRWKLSTWNIDRNTNCWQRVPRLPWGTLSANLLGAIISILCTGFLDSKSGAIFHPWVEALLFAVKVGFAGSLSTVSSLAKEITNLSEKYPGHAKPHIYGSVTILSGMLISLCIYAGIVRSMQ